MRSVRAYIKNQKSQALTEPDHFHQNHLTTITNTSKLSIIIFSVLNNPFPFDQS